MKFSIITFGCKVNHYESNMMKEKMLHHNFSYTEDLSEAEIIIVNTCTVTNTADTKCLKSIRKIKREYPSALLVVAGCSTQNKPDTYHNLNIDILIGNKDKSKIVDLIKEHDRTKKSVERIYEERMVSFEDMFINDYKETRAFMKIEDGCDNFCSYCIIPFVRGSVRSKDFDIALKEAKELVKSNHQEIVLTGIHTGRYFSEGKCLSDLIHEMSKIEGLNRIRLSSIEITELNDYFLQELKNNPKICNHLHIPLQSGSDFILKKMNRKYDTKYFLNKVKEIRKIRPDISITTDIIVGHPYETEELFNETLIFAREISFAKIHVFPYSKRERTASALMPMQVDEKEKKERVRALMGLSNELEKAYFEKFKNQKLDILIEQVVENKSMGHTSNYLYVCVDEKLEVGKIYSRLI